MSLNKLVINLTGTTDIEVAYSGTVSNIETASVSFNGSARPNAKKRVKSPFAYISSKEDDIYLIINKLNQFKVIYKNVFTTKGNLNGGPTVLSEITVTEQQIDESKCTLSDD